MANDNMRKDEVADFSQYFDKNNPQGQSNNEAPITEETVKKRFLITKRILWMAGLLAVLVIIQIIILFNRPEAGTFKVPDGYRLVAPNNGPPKLEKIK